MTETGIHRCCILHHHQLQAKVAERLFSWGRVIACAASDVVSLSLLYHSSLTRLSFSAQPSLLKMSRVSVSAINALTFGDALPLADPDCVRQTCCAAVLGRPAPAQPPSATQQHMLMESSTALGMHALCLMRKNALADPSCRSKAATTGQPGNEDRESSRGPGDEPFSWTSVSDIRLS